MKRRQCSKCGALLRNRLVIDGKLRVLNSRKYCLSCSPWGQHNTKKIEDQQDRLTRLKSLADLPDNRICNLCDKELPIKDFGVHKTKSGYKIYSYCRRCDTSRNLEKANRLKRLAVEYKGGKCQICGYDKCTRAMEFHHRDPDSKEIEVSKFRNISFERLKPELDKCDLLCCRCHREIECGHSLTVKRCLAKTDSAGPLMTSPK